MKTIKTISLIGLLAITVSAMAKDESQNTLFQQANSAYDSGDYAHAEELYSAIVDNGYDSWELRYNLGNAHYRLDNIGQAILNYERALRMEPGNKNVKDNLELARSHTTDNIEELPKMFLWTWVDAVAQLMTPKGWRTSVIIIMVLVCASIGFFLVARDYKARKRFLVISLMAVIVLIFTAFNATISQKNATRTDEAIITDPLVVVKGSPDAKSVDKFILHEGTKLYIKDQQDDWWQVEIADGKSGWINGGAERV